MDALSASTEKIARCEGVIGAGGANSVFVTRYMVLTVDQEIRITRFWRVI